MPKLEQMPFDKRLRDLNLKRGKITQKEIDKYIKDLPDDADQAEELVISEEETESLASESKESSEDSENTESN